MRSGRRINDAIHPLWVDSDLHQSHSLPAETTTTFETREIGNNHHLHIIFTLSNMSVDDGSGCAVARRKHNHHHSGCPLCDLPDVSVEHAGNIPGENHTIRQIMAQELLGFGTLPNNLIYARIARAYNTRVHRPTTLAGFHCVKWTGSLVKTHFEKHVCLVPRRIVSKDLTRCEKYLRIVEREINATVSTAEDPTDLVDTKMLNKAVMLMKMKQSLLKDLRCYVKEDLTVTGCDLVSKQMGSGNLDGEDARDILMTMHASANGVGPSGISAFVTAPGAGDDLPVGEEVFE